MKRLLVLSVVTLMSFGLMGCQLFQQQPKDMVDDISESSTATVNIREDQTATSTATLTIAEPDTATATTTLEISETEE